VTVTDGRVTRIVIVKSFAKVKEEIDTEETVLVANVVEVLLGGVLVGFRKQEQT